MFRTTKKFLINVFNQTDFYLTLTEWSNNTSYKEAFLRGYAIIRKVPEYGRLMPLLRLSRAIGAIGFTVKRRTWESKGAKIYQFNRKYLDEFLNFYNLFIYNSLFLSINFSNICIKALSSFFVRVLKNLASVCSTDGSA